MITYFLQNTSDCVTIITTIFHRLPPISYRADFSEPIEPVIEPEATFVWKGEEGGGLKLDKVNN